MSDVADDCRVNTITFLHYVWGVCSITKTVLTAHGRIPPDPEEKENIDRRHAELMRGLCRDLRVSDDGVSGLDEILDLLDAFKDQGRKSTLEQANEPQRLNQEYVPRAILLL